ncbi:hypothetical protein Fmac_005619 [Flemingia macrophylla]|uniref:Uncharacterized protein n=1 Tax=Flemingia macrophylla TaxID=520843 RepID=A0ABD1N898_9FABA
MPRKRKSPKMDGFVMENVLVRECVNINIVHEIKTLYAMTLKKAILNGKAEVLRMTLLEQKASLTDIKSESELKDNRNEYQRGRNSEKVSKIV